MDPIGEQVGTESDSLDFANAALATGVTRRRERTEKGKAFIAHVRWTDSQTLFRRIQRQMKEIDSLATDEENVDVVERNLTSFRFSVEVLKAGFAGLLNDLESKEDLDIVNEWYINLNERINDFLDKTVLWISTAKETIEHSLETRSQVGSLYSTSRRSKASSRHSSRSITSSTAKEKGKAAELKARVAMLEKRKELELRVEKLRLEVQLAVARCERVCSLKLKGVSAMQIRLVVKNCLRKILLYRHLLHLGRFFRLSQALTRLQPLRLTPRLK